VAAVLRPPPLFAAPLTEPFGAGNGGTSGFDPDGVGSLPLPLVLGPLLALTLALRDWDRAKLDVDVDVEGVIGVGVPRALLDPLVLPVVTITVTCGVPVGVSGTTDVDRVRLLLRVSSSAPAPAPVPVPRLRLLRPVAVPALPFTCVSSSAFEVTAMVTAAGVPSFFMVLMFTSVALGSEPDAAAWASAAVA
jgi:hypothetical protein